MQFIKGKFLRRSQPKQDVTVTEGAEAPSIQPKPKKKTSGLETLFIVARWMLYIYVSLLPLFFLPLTDSPVALNKEFFAIAILTIVFVIWLIEVVSQGKLVLRKTFLNLTTLLLVVAAGISAFFSQSVWVSIFGFSGQTDTLTMFGIYFLTFFLVSQFFGSPQEIKKIAYGMSGAFFVSSFLFVMQVFGVPLIPFSFAKNAIFNTVGTVNAASLYFALGALWGVVLWAGAKNITEKIASLAVLFAGYVALIAVEFQIALYAVIVALVLYLVMQLFGKGMVSVNKMILPTVLVVLTITIAAGVLSLPSLSLRAKTGSQVVEVSPTPAATFDAAVNTAKGGVLKSIFGEGPSMFTYQWLKVRPVELNSTNFWNVRFYQGYSGIFSQLSNLGIIGILAFLALIINIIFVVLAVFFFIRKKTLLPDDENLLIGSLCSVVFLLICWFVYPFVFTLNVLLFTFLAITIILYTHAKKQKLLREINENETFSDISAAEKEQRVEKELLRTIDFTNKPQKTLLFTLVAVSLITFAVIFLYTEGQRYAGAVYFEKGNEYLSAGKTDEALNAIGQAVQYDSHNDSYWRALTQMHLAKINVLIEGPITDQNTFAAQLADHQKNAADSAQMAITMNGIDPFNWAMKGVVFETAVSYVDNSDQASALAAAAFHEASVRDPLSPLRTLDEARTQLLTADQIARKVVLLESQKEKNTQAIDQAKKLYREYVDSSMKLIEKTIALKKDYAPAHYLMAQIYDRMGDLKSAIKKTEELRYSQVADLGIVFQLGFLYFKDGQWDNAQREFETAVANSPNYSNARYFLGLIYDKKGMKDKAIEQFERIAQLNPGNNEIKQALDLLKSGKSIFVNNAPALPTPETIQSPSPEEMPAGGASSQQEIEGGSLQAR
jgi:Tfp pilus assembly protein PilF